MLACVGSIQIPKPALPFHYFLLSVQCSRDRNPGIPISRWVTLTLTFSLPFSDAVNLPRDVNYSVLSRTGLTGEFSPGYGLF